MRNLTISLDEKLARWTRVAAAERDVSVSRFVRDLLEQKMNEERAYETAMRRSLARRGVALKAEGGVAYPTRDELHE